MRIEKRRYPVASHPAVKCSHLLFVLLIYKNASNVAPQRSTTVGILKGFKSTNKLPL